MAVASGSSMDGLDWVNRRKIQDLEVRKDDLETSSDLCFGDLFFLNGRQVGLLCPCASRKERVTKPKLFSMRIKHAIGP